MEGLQTKVNYHKSTADDLRKEVDGAKDQLVSMTRERDDLAAQIEILKAVQVRVWSDGACELAVPPVGLLQLAQWAA